MYFGFEDDHVNAVLADVKKNDATGQLATATTGGLVDLFVWVSFPNNLLVADPFVNNVSDTSLWLLHVNLRKLHLQL